MYKAKTLHLGSNYSENVNGLGMGKASRLICYLTWFIESHLYEIVLSCYTNKNHTWSVVSLFLEVKVLDIKWKSFCIVLSTLKL